MKKKTPGCQIHLIHASAAPVAVVLRRGPGDWTHLSLLDTETDTLTPGAWFNGRIYENSCDLSPDGELFLFKVLPSGKIARTGGKKSPPKIETPPIAAEPINGMELRGAWTGVSHPPFLEPLALWPHGNTWDGGGYFTDTHKLTIVARKELVAEPQHTPEAAHLEVSFDDALLRSPSSTKAATCCRDLDGNLICARDGKLFRQIRWQCGKEIEIADLNGLKP